MLCFNTVKDIFIGHEQDFEAGTGCTAILLPHESRYGVSIRGSAPALRGVATIEQLHIIDVANAIFLTGGSAYGLDAVGGVMKFLEEKKKGLKIADFVIPTVPSAVIYDLNIGDGKKRPDQEMGYNACKNAKVISNSIEQGCVGVGTGATIGKILGIANSTKGGIGIAQNKLSGVDVVAVTVVNAFGDVKVPAAGKIIAGARKEESSYEFISTKELVLQGVLSKRKVEYVNTTLSVLLIDAYFNRVELTKIASLASDAFPICIEPNCTMLDGDVLFTVSTGKEKADLHAIAIAGREAVIQSILSAVWNAKSMFEIPSANEIKNGNKK